MMIVVMSDTHLTKLTASFQELCEQYCTEADLVIHLGDSMAGPVLDYLEQYPLEAVAGNMDDASIQRRLPDKKIIQVESYRIGLTHGWGNPFGLRGRLLNDFKGVDAILFGHTHEALQLHQDGIFWFNPGSVTLGRGSSRESLGILHINDTIRSEIIPL